MSDSSRPHGLQPTKLLHPWDFPGKSPGVGCHCLLRVTGLDDINSRSDIAEEKMSELENTAQGTIQNKKIHKIYDGSILNSVIGNWNKMLWLKRQ